MTDSLLSPGPVTALGWLLLAGGSACLLFTWHPLLGLALSGAGWLSLWRAWAG